jgi:hypothetical protein
MPLPIDVRALANRILARLDEFRDFYLHTQQAWRVVQQIAHEGRAVGIVDTPSGQEVPAPDLEPLAQRYVTLAASDRDAILGGMVERVVRELVYRRPAQWFRFLDNRVNLECPDVSQRESLCELKAARDALEYNRGLVGPDYIEKAGSSARFAVSDTVEIDEPYLLGCFALLRDVVEAMAVAAIRRSSGPSAH